MEHQAKSICTRFLGVTHPGSSSVISSMHFLVMCGPLETLTWSIGRCPTVQFFLIRNKMEFGRKMSIKVLAHDWFISYLDQFNFNMVFWRTRSMKSLGSWLNSLHASHVHSYLFVYQCNGGWKGKCVNKHQVYEWINSNLRYLFYEWVCWCRYVVCDVGRWIQENILFILLFRMDQYMANVIKIKAWT